MASTISAARSALYDLLVTAASTNPPSGTALQGVQVSWGDPLAYEEQEVVTLGGVGPVARTFTGYDKTFGLRLRVKVYGPEDDAETVDARGWEVAGGLHDLVYANRTLSGSVDGAVADDGSSEFGAQRVVDAPGWIIFIDVAVDCGRLWRGDG